jgi:5'-nucleotidase / UDP-sugar diphosphatase
MILWMWLAAFAEPSDDAFVILHTGDLHAHFLPSVHDGKVVGGALALSATAERVRGDWGQDRVLMLDAGDLLSGTPIDEYVVQGAHGGAMVELLGHMGYDGWVLGNHEFDRGLSNTSAVVAASSVPVLSANLSAPGGGPLFDELLPHRVYQVGGFTVGVVGATTEALHRLTGDELAVGVGSVEAAVSASLAAMGKVDVSVALTHIGLQEDVDLARDVPELDLILGGHTHSRLTEPKRIGDTWIVHTGEYARGMGILEVRPKGEGAVAVDYQLEEPTSGEGARKQVAEFTQRWGRVIDREWGRPVGETSLAITRDGGAETPLGRFVGQVLREQTGADVGVTNLGGLRADLAEGILTRQDLYALFPFGNDVVVADVKGGDLVALGIRNSMARLEPGRAAAMQQNGLTYVYRERLGVAELVSVQVGGKRVDPSATYRIATSSFVWTHWQRMMGAKPAGKVTSTNTTMLETTEQWLAKNGPVSMIPAAPGIRVDE